MLYKSDKEKCYHILTVDANPSNMHDLVVFYSSFENLNNYFNIRDIKYFVRDAVYITSHICKTLIELDLISAFPYNRLGYRKNINLSMMRSENFFLC